MGQQQLILLVLATVIVGVAIVIGVRAFTENNVKNNYDNLVHDATRMASDAAAWKQKPESFGGQATANKAPGTWTGLDFEKMGYHPTTGTTCVFNENGWFQVSVANGNILAGNANTNNQVTVLLPTAASPKPALDLTTSGASVRGTAQATQPAGCLESTKFGYTAGS